MRHIHIDQVDHIGRPVVAIGNIYPDGHSIAPHHHRRGQLMSAISGLIVLTTPTGTWVMPPQRGMWIPPCATHNVRMVGTVTMQSLYIEPDAIPDMPDMCQVVSISPFVRELINEALDLPVDYETHGRVGTLMQLLLYEVAQLPPLPLSLPYPNHTMLATRCRTFTLAPNIHETIDEWCGTLGMSRRTFTRLFRRETSMSFKAWCLQACLLSAIPRLASGEQVTNVALDLGYENPAAFTLMFKRAFGSPPLSYLGLRNNK
ncbi:AraC family transcriptional regulator [Paenochrobactrum pullorum]|uniref:AraC family transcriptional regulator n=1 Tax=Paenochrobactrum pullorum TaxID=1324351 RepID=UPI0035BC80CE